MKRRIILLDSGGVEWPDNSDQLNPDRVSSPGEIEDALGRDENTIWVARDPRRLLDFVERGRSRKRRDLLLLEPAGRLRMEALRQLFDRVVAPDEAIDLLPEEQIFAIFAQDHPGDYFIGAGYNPTDGLVLLYRGTMDALSLKEDVFEENELAEPDFEHCEVTDWGQTLRLGDYEIDADTLLYPRDADFRRRQKERQRELDDSFGGSLRRLRLMKGLNQDEIGDLPPKTIRRIENNEVSPRDSTIRTIADTLGVEPEEIESY